MSESQRTVVCAGYSDIQLASVGTVSSSSLGEYSQEEWLQLGRERSRSYKRHGQTVYVRKKPSDKHLNLAINKMKKRDQPLQQKIYNEEGWIVGIRTVKMSNQGIQESYEDIKTPADSNIIGPQSIKGNTSPSAEVEQEELSHSDFTMSTLSALIEESFPSPKVSTAEPEYSSDRTLSSSQLHLYIEPSQDTVSGDLTPSHIERVETSVTQARSSPCLPLAETPLKKKDMHGRSFVISVDSPDLQFLESPILNPTVSLERLSPSHLDSDKIVSSTESILDLADVNDMSLLSNLSPSLDVSSSDPNNQETLIMETTSQQKGTATPVAESEALAQTLKKINSILQSSTLFKTQDMFSALSSISRIPEVVAQSTDSFYLAVLAQLHRSGQWHDVGTPSDFRCKLKQYLLQHKSMFQAASQFLFNSMGVDLNTYIQEQYKQSKRVTCIDVYVSARMLDLPFFLISADGQWEYPFSDKSVRKSAVTNIVVLYNGANGFMGSKSLSKRPSQRKLEETIATTSNTTSEQETRSPATENAEVEKSSPKRPAAGKKKLKVISKKVPVKKITNRQTRSSSNSTSQHSSTGNRTQHRYVLRSPERQQIARTLRSSGTSHKKAQHKDSCSPQAKGIRVTAPSKLRKLSVISKDSSSSSVPSVSRSVSSSIKVSSPKQFPVQPSMPSTSSDTQIAHDTSADNIYSSADSYDSSTETDYTKLDLSVYGSKDKEYFLSKTIRCIKHLKKKIKRISSPRSGHCPRCGFMEVKDMNISSHKITQRHSTLTPAPSCDAGIESIDLTHNLSDNRQQYVCDICLLVFVDSESLIRHKQTHLVTKFRCDICFKEFSHERTLKSHRLTHESGPLKCEICPKEFNRKDKLETHLQEHKGSFKFSCQECSKGFSTKSQLQQHLMTHVQDKPYKCHVCGNTYKREQELKSHLEMKCQNTEMFTCSYEGCDKSFKSKRYLKTHTDTHEEGNVHVCSKCGKSFKSRSGFWKHNLKKH